MSKHTDGPWKVIGGDEDTYDICPDDAIGGVVAIAYSEANAKLIAAAPGLLELADQYASECAECTGDGVLDATGESCPDCAHIRAVIARARPGLS